MQEIQKSQEKSSENSIRDDIEKAVVVVPTEEVDADLQSKPQQQATPNGDRPLVLMDLDNGLVGWESAEDPENPLNWSSGRKWFLMFWAITMTTLSPMLSSICAPGTSLTLDEFGLTSRTIGTLMITIYILGYALGPLFLAPLSELYGRRVVVNTSSVFLNAFLIGCAFAPNMPVLIVMRFLAGLAGSAIMTIVSALIADVFRVHERSAASAIVIGTPSLSPVIGPIVGAFVAQHLGWRWSYYIMLILVGPTMIAMFVFMRESNHPTILARKTARLRKELGRDQLRSQLEPDLPPREILSRAMIRPLKLLFKSPIIVLVALYVSTLYGILYLMFATIPDVFQDIYGFEVQYTGLAYLGLGVGMLIAIACMMKFNENTVTRLRRENGGVYEPEMRLANTIYFAPCVPISLFMYAWTARSSVHWIVPCISFLPFGMGMGFIFVTCQNYAADAFLTYAASAVAVLVFMRSIFGTFIPLIGPNVYEALGLGWGNTLLGFLAILVTPVPFAFLKWGEVLRKRFVIDL